MGGDYSDVQHGGRKRGCIMPRKLLFSLTKKDFNIECFCAGGHGGQNMQKNAIVGGIIGTVIVNGYLLAKWAIDQRRAEREFEAEMRRRYGE